MSIVAFALAVSVHIRVVGQGHVDYAPVARGLRLKHRFLALLFDELGVFAGFCLEDFSVPLAITLGVQNHPSLYADPLPAHIPIRYCSASRV